MTDKNDDSAEFVANVRPAMPQVGHRRDRLQRVEMPWCLLLLAVFAGGCVTLTPDGARVSVYRAPLDGLPFQRTMSEGCRLLATNPPISMTELDIEGEKDPFHRERNEAGAVGANVLLVLSRMTISRHDSECPGSSPITDCPPSFGAWFRVAIESYECTPDALRKLSALASTATQSSRFETLHP